MLAKPQQTVATYEHCLTVWLLQLDELANYIEMIPRAE
jgi:hypothetical protein